MWKNIRLYRCVAAALGSVILAFGLYHVHSFAGVTEGGVLGMTLLLDHWLHLSPAVTGFVLNAVCFLFGWRVLGREFVVYSVIATAAFSGSYALVEQMEPLWPQLYHLPLLAAVVGAAFVGVGAGISVWAGGALRPCGVTRGPCAVAGSAPSSAPLRPRHRAICAAR